MEEQAKPMTPNEGRLAVLEAEYSLSPVRTRMEEQAIDLPPMHGDLARQVSMRTAEEIYAYARAAVLAERERCARVGPHHTIVSCKLLAREGEQIIGPDGSIFLHQYAVIPLEEYYRLGGSWSATLPSSPAT